VRTWPSTIMRRAVAKSVIGGIPRGANRGLLAASSAPRQGARHRSHPRAQNRRRRRMAGVQGGVASPVAVSRWEDRATRPGGNADARNREFSCKNPPLASPDSRKNSSVMAPAPMSPLSLAGKRPYLAVGCLDSIWNQFRGAAFPAAKFWNSFARARAGAHASSPVTAAFRLCHPRVIHAAADDRAPEGGA
jgi:hypothetical protein